MIPIKTEAAWHGTSDCRTCGIREVALFADLNEHDFGAIHFPIDDLNYKHGTSIYEEGDSAQAIFTLRSGMVKLVRTTTDGRKRTVRVLRSGDVVGLEALAATRYDSDAVALTPISVCRIPTDVIHNLSKQSVRMHDQLMRKWQCALKDADDWLADLNFGTARQRVCNLVLKMRSADNAEISILFSRDDIGAMLNMKPETVSRELSRLTRDGTIDPLDAHGRIYRVIHAERLETVEPDIS